MRSLNNGLVFSNEQCIACNKCISVCNVFGANVAVNNAVTYNSFSKGSENLPMESKIINIMNGNKQIFVDDKKCLHCGKCIATCPHNAREYSDDTDRFLEDLLKGEKINIIFSTSFSTFYDKEAKNIVGYLKSFENVGKIYSAGIGDRISAWAHAKYLKENINKPVKSRAFIANVCESIVERIENYYPYLIYRLIPVQSPVMCSGIYLKKYLKLDGKIAFIGPCIAKYNEFHKDNTEEIISYNVTFDHLFKKLREMQVNYSHYSSDFDQAPIPASDRVAFHGNFKALVSKFFPPNSNFIEMEGFDSEKFVILSILQGSDSDNTLQNTSEQSVTLQPLMVDIQSCENGCHKGPGIEASRFNYEKLFLNYAKITANTQNNKNYDELWQEEENYLSSLNPEDFSCSFKKLYHQNVNVPDNIYRNIFNIMLKNTEEKRNINCGSCGYKTCRDMARAIAYGYNLKENCIHYMNDLMQQSLIIDKECNIPNKNYIFRYGMQLLENNIDKKYVICNGNINGLKVINDIYGFAAGDKVLKHIAGLLSELTDKNEICARMGADNFTLLLEYTPEKMQRLHNLKSFDCRKVGIPYPITMRFGLFIPKDQEYDLKMMMNLAEICRDKQSSSTQNTYTVYSDDFRQNTIEELELSSKFQMALDNKEFVLWFQPQYKAQTGDLVGAEALCRWIDSSGTVISPIKFIPIAEKNGFIRKLDVEIWRMAFEAVHRWLGMGMNPVPISVNISRVSLSDDVLISVISHLLDEYEVPTEYIHFEVTESAYMEDQKNLIARIEKIRELGFQIAMDDFGSGYSSLNTLKDLPIDILKLDMGFLREQTNMDKGGKIISTLVQMAQNLEYTTIAEGVENQEQSDFLATIGVDIIQGYLYAKPMPEDKFLTLFSSNEKITSFSKTERTGILRMENLYNPMSSESIMFDKLSGASAIFEYSSKSRNLELFRINQKCLKIFGFEQLPFKDIKKNLKYLFQKDTQNQFIDSVIKSIQTGSEVIIVTKNKEYHKQNTVWTKLYITEVSQKEDVHIIYVRVEDITDEKNSEKTLELSNKQLTSMLTEARTGMWLILIKFDLMNFMNSLQIKVIKVNHEFEELSGYSEEELLSLNEREIISLIHPKNRPGLIMSFYKNFTEGFKKRMVCKYSLKHKDGTYIPLKILIDAVKQEDDTYLGVINFIEEDIKKSEES
ncbi:MAG: EAL domain-containing protein [Treponema sp.]|nr:EAL domain-containing protein [Treponema sp.]